MRGLAVFLNWLHQVCLSLWLGGILILGAVGAPAVFGAAKAQGQSTIDQPLYRFAGEAMGVAFARFNWVALVAGAMMLLTGLAYGRIAGLCRRRLTVRAILTGIALAITAWLTFGLYPTMLAARAAQDMPAFDGMHKTYSSMSMGVGLVLLTITFLTGWMHLDLEPHA